MQIKSKGLNADHLKLIAIAAMTIDHFSDLIYPGYPADPVSIAIHLIGRLTAPIMWFFICEGYYYTRSVKRYLLRLGFFTVISHFAYCFAFGIDMIPFRTGLFNQTSVMYPLMIAVLVLWIDEKVTSLPSWGKFLLCFLLIWSAFPADWSCIAVMAVLGMYHKRGDLKGQMLEIIKWVLVYGLVSWFFVSRVYAVILIGVLLVYPVLKCYNGQKGTIGWLKWFFYLYYPAHLIVIGILRLWIYGDISLLF